MNPLPLMALLKAVAGFFGSLLSFLQRKSDKKAGADEVKVEISESIIKDVQKVKDAKTRADNNPTIAERLRKRYKL